MNIWEFVILLVLIGAVVKIKVLQGRQREGAARRVDDADLELSRDEVRQLKERIQVLERVITDNHSSSDLDREIERLRDR